MPSPGWSGEYDWTGYIPYEEMPRVFNPASHFVATANNQVVPDSYPYFIAYDWSPPYRAQRITDLLQSKEKLSVEDFRHMQADVFDIPAGIFTPYLLQISPDNDREKRALELLKKWDFNDRADAAAPAIFNVFYMKLLKNTLEDELGDKLFSDYLKPMGSSGDVNTIFMAGIMQDNSNPWFDNVVTGQHQTRDEVVKKSFSEAVEELAGKYGPDPAQWKWGALHTIKFQHVLGRIALLDFVFSRGPMPLPGSRYTVDVAAFEYYNPYAVTAIPSYRQIIDWSDPDKSLAMHSTGQSGLAFSKHYDDMIPSWLNVRYHTMLFDKKDIKANEQGLLRLQPAPADGDNGL